MADNQEPNPMDAEAVAAANAAVRDTLETQGRDGLKPGPSTDEFKSTSDSLDSIAKAQEAEKSKQKPEIEPVVEAKPDQKPDPAAPKPDPAAAKPDPDPAPKPDEALVKAADEMFKGINLPQGASIKSGEAFNRVKLMAVKDIAARDAKLAEMQKQIDELNEKLKTPVPPEVERELKEHREWRAKIDVEYDPKFNEHTKGIAAAKEFVYAQLKKGGLSDEFIEKIKQHGGPENVDLTRVFEKGGPNGGAMDNMTRRLVESKVADIEQMKFNREQAIQHAKANISEYVKAQEAARSKVDNAHNEATRGEFSKLSAQLTWLQPVKPEKNDEASKKAAEEYNAFVEKTKKDMEVALADDSAEMRAIMVAGMGQLFYTKRELAIANAKLEASEKALKEATAKVDKYINASRSKLPESGASPNPAPPAQRKVDYTQLAGDSLDEIAKQVMAERERAANQPSA